MAALNEVPDLIGCALHCGLNPTSLLPGAISLAETVLVKDYW
jgi:hypothetical protein